ncbi:hypothetical protein HDV05_005744 [Chytridiales sp. JEL 0842]|nr:hypothetical protein HDV05_005744 [Chytridiales sp. JEL 0842]
MLEEADLDMLYGTLAQLDLPLETIMLTLQSHFHTSDRLLELSGTLAVMLRERILLPQPILRIPALYALFNWYSAMSTYAPIFLSTILSYIESSLPQPSTAENNPVRHTLNDSGIDWGPPISDSEKWVICCCLMSPKRLSGINTRQIITGMDHGNVVRALADPGLIQRVRALREEIHNKLGGSCLIVPGIFSIPEDDDAANSEPTVEEALQAAKQVFGTPGSSALDLLQFDPPQYIPMPKVLEPRPDEFIWLHPVSRIYPLEFDPNTPEDIQKRDEARNLMYLALKKPLTHPQQKLVIDQLEANPKFIHLCELNPSDLPNLIENNPNIAVEALLRLMGTSKVNAFFEILKGMTISLHSMEVINRLASFTVLPQDFVMSYVSNCMQSCEKVKDKYLQNRQVRLVGVLSIFFSL